VANGLCDVAGCDEKTLMGWRPHTVSQEYGRQICRDHWEKHKDQRDSFSLFKAFGYPRPAAAKIKPAEQLSVATCACGRALLPKRRFCAVCATKRERDRKREWQRQSKSQPVIEAPVGPKCQRCDNQREPGRVYCGPCAKIRERERRRQWARKTRKMSTVV
jgi:hypothetical protein